MFGTSEDEILGEWIRRNALLSQRNNLSFRYTIMYPRRFDNIQSTLVYHQLKIIRWGYEGFRWNSLTSLAGWNKRTSCLPIIHDHHLFLAPRNLGKFTAILSYPVMPVGKGAVVNNYVLTVSEPSLYLRCRSLTWDRPRPLFSWLV